MKSHPNRFIRVTAVALALAAPHAQADTSLWTGAVNGNWNTTTPNWSNTGSGNYTSGDIVQFGDTGGANLGISIISAVTPASVTFTDTGAGTNAYTFSTSAINGSGTVTLDSGFGGSAQFNVSNGYTGATTINGGKLIYGNGVTSVSAAHSIASGATLELNYTSGTTSSGTTTFSGAGTLLKTGNGTASWGATAATFALGAGSLIDVQAGTFTGGSNSNEVWTTNLSDLNVASGAIFDGVEANVRVNKITGNGTIKTGYSTVGSITLGVDNGSSQFDGVIANSSAAGSIVKTGSGTITLTGANTNTGTTTIGNGTIILGGGDNRLATAARVVLGATGTSGALVLGNGTALNQTLAGLTTAGNGGAVVGGAAANSTLTLNIASGTNTFGGKLGGVGANENNLALIKSGAGALALSAANTYIGGTTLNEGILTVGNASSLGTGTVTLNGGTFKNSASFTMANAIDVTGTTAMYAGAANFDLSGSVTGNGTMNTGGSLGAAASLQFANTVDLSGFTGTITHANVTNLNNTAFLGTLNTTAKFSTTGATASSRYLQFAGGTIGELSGTGGVVRLMGTLNVNQSTNTTYAGVIANTGGLQKSGNGTLTLSNTNTYTGATAVKGGKLTIDTGGTINGTSGVTIGTASTAAAAEFNYNSSMALTKAVSFAAGSTGGKLSGTGTINLGLNITADNTLAIGNGVGNQIGAMAFGNNLEVGGTFLHELFGGGSTADLGDVAGNLTLGGILDLVQLGTYTAGNKFTLFAYDGTLTGLFRDSGGVTSILDDTNFTDAGGIWKLNYNDTTAGLNGGVSASNTYVTITAIPEPNVAALIGGFGTILLLRRRR